MQSPPDNSFAALEPIIAGFAETVRRVAWRHRLSDADVDEVMQEVRIRVWRSREGATEPSEQIIRSPASYIYRTAVSAALDLLRRRRTEHARMTVPLDEHVSVGQGTQAADSELEAAELAEQVGRAIDTIPASRRPVVRMYLAGHPREEIADLMGWSEAKTRNLLYRGLADLRERLVKLGITLETTT